MGLCAEVTNTEVDGEPSLCFKAVEDLNTNEMEPKLRKHSDLRTKF